MRFLSSVFILLYLFNPIFSQSEYKPLDKLFDCNMVQSSIPKSSFIFQEQKVYGTNVISKYQCEVSGIPVYGSQLTIFTRQLGEVYDYYLPPITFKMSHNTSYSSTDVNVRNEISSKHGTNLVFKSVKKIIYPKTATNWINSWQVVFENLSNNTKNFLILCDGTFEIFLSESTPFFKSRELSGNRNSVDGVTNIQSSIMCNGPTTPFEFRNPYTSNMMDGELYIGELPVSPFSTNCRVGDFEIDLTLGLQPKDKIRYYDQIPGLIHPDKISDNYPKMYTYYHSNEFLKTIPEIREQIMGSIYFRIGSTAGVSYSGTEIIYENEIWQKDISGAVTGVAAYVFRNAKPQQNTGLMVGSSDFIAQLYKWENTETNTHNVFTGPGLPARRTDSEACYDPTLSFEHNAPVWSTLLMKIHTDIINDYDISMSMAFESMEIFIESDGQTQAAEKLYSLLKQPDYGLTQAQICQVRNIILGHYDCLPVALQFTLNDSDYFIRDSDIDNGDEPEMTSQMWTSPDIINRYEDDTNWDHQNPRYINPSTKNYIKVRVRNRGCSNDDALHDKKLKVYYSMASTGLTWKEDWVTNGVPLEDEPLITGIDGGNSDGIFTTYTFPWTPPNPAELSGDKQHICIYARITDGTSENEGQGNVKRLVGNIPTIYDETPHVGDNTQNCNNIAWKNMSLIDKTGPMVGGNNETTLVTVRNPIPQGDPTNPNNLNVSDPFDIICVINQPPTNPNDPTEGVVDLTNPFNNPTHQTGANNSCEVVREAGPYTSDPDFFNKGDVYINFRNENSTTWNSSGLTGTGFTTGTDGWLKMTSPSFKLSGINLVRGQRYVIGVRYTPKPNFAPSSFALVQTYPDGKVVGGETYVIHGTPTFSKGVDVNQNLLVSDIKTTDINDVTIKPNPVTDMMDVYLENSKEIKSMTIFDIAGKRIKELSGQGSNYMQINMQMIDIGVYTVKVVDVDGTEIIKKIVKQ